MGSNRVEKSIIQDDEVPLATDYYELFDSKDTHCAD